jgi:cell division protein FtsI/penicillin-binding protein 2
VRRRAVLLALVLTLAGGTAGWWFVLRSDAAEQEAARATAAAYLAAWERGDLVAMRALLVGEPPTAFVEAHAEVFEALAVQRARFVLGEVVVEDGAATAGFRARLDLAGLGEWGYRGALALAERGGKWRIAWAAPTIHPALAAGLRLERRRSWPERAPILGRKGTRLVEPRPVIVVGVEPRRIKNRRTMLRALERLIGAEPEAVRRDLEAPGVQPDWFIPVTELRPERYRAVRPELYPVPGVVFRRAASRLPPSDGFAAHVLGRVGEVTAERLEELGAPYLPGDEVGLSGLEFIFERRLAGRPSDQVVLVDEAGEVVRVLHRVREVRPRPLRTALDREVQAAAEVALAGVAGPAALVALDWRSGWIRAVAGRPLEEEFNRALAGLYPPGSTFKVVTAAALLFAGLRPAERVDCPEEALVGGRSFRNAPGTPLGSITFESAFVYSCNTAFVRLAETLPQGALEAAAQMFGFGARYELPLPVAGGRFPAPGDAAETAAAAIGQGRIEVSPLHLATVAATVASGRWQAPRLLTGGKGEVGDPLDQAVAGVLRELMRLVVLEGTGTAAGVPGFDLAGKTGTAEFGDEDPPATHAWFIGFEDELALAVLVEGGGPGGEVAAPLAARFLNALSG